MPRKRAVLPRPCPLCGRTDGTYQYVIFNHEYTSSRNALICRIGHYDTNYYLSRQIGKISSTVRSQIKRPYGKTWHSFKVQPTFDILHGRGKINPGRYFDRRFKRGKGKKVTSITIKPPPGMPDLIKKEGWQMIPEESLYNKRRKLKEYPNPILTEEEKEWFAKRKKYTRRPS